MSCTFWNMRRRKAAAILAAQEAKEVVENPVESVENTTETEEVVENLVENVEKSSKKRGGSK